MGESNGTVTASFWDLQASGQTTSAGGTGKTTVEMQTIETFLDVGWDFVDESGNGTSQVWRMPQGGGYPVLAIFDGYTPPELQGLGTPEAPYLISNALELGAIVYHSPSAHYRLTASIDLSGIHWGTAVIPYFAGTFDGNHHEISHLTVDGGAFLGVFGRLVSGAEVTDLELEEVSITGSAGYIGGLAGFSDGFLMGGGGLITRCSSTGTVRGSGSWEAVGGLVGSSWSTDVIQCYSTGSVLGGSSVGGLVGGHIGGTLSNCYSTATVRGATPVGGLLGENRGGTVMQCYSAGAVTRGGGLVGENNTTIAASFWDLQTSGQTASAGGIGKTTAEMRTASTFLEAAWDFVDETANGTDGIWWIDEGKDYPRLWWELQEPEETPEQ
ncbi:MAG: hypothetical protein A2Y77_03880 [Planctomycetes bacterium RBG_13_62_9]|nr:MAG: hypothetical protein A2Y77_03880 [Planctomycetes bacterium RBG_13_62_9]